MKELDDILLMATGKASLASAKLRDIEKSLTGSELRELEAPGVTISDSLRLKMQSAEESLTAAELRELEAPGVTISDSLRLKMQLAEAAQAEHKEKLSQVEAAREWVVIAGEIEEEQRLDKIRTTILKKFYGHSTSKPTPIDESGPLLSEAWKKYTHYMETDPDGWRMVSASDHARRKTMETRFREFLAIVGDKPINHVTHEDAEAVRAGFLSKPLATRHGTKASLKAISPASAKKMLSAIKAFFVHLRKKRYLSDNVFEYVEIGGKSNNNASYEAEDLHALFNLPEDRITSAGRFWIPRICVLMALRQGEATQLRPSDIRQTPSGDWYAHIHENSTEGEPWKKTLKSKNSTRIIPLHKALIQNGFLKYHQKVIDAGHEWTMWPDLLKDGVPDAGKISNHWGKLSKGINPIVKEKIGSTGGRKCFHSLRRYLANQLIVGNTTDRIIKAIVGHSPDLGITMDYIDSVTTIPQKQEAIEQVSADFIGWEYPQKFQL